MLQLSFVPDAVGTTDNPQVVFEGRDATPEGRRLQFTIPAGQTTVPLAINIQQGTVAGRIRVELIELKQGIDDVLPAAHPFSKRVIPRQAPVITVAFDPNETANGFDVVISGYSTPREMKTVTLTFTGKQGEALAGAASFTIDVSKQFSDFYLKPEQQMAGSMFTNFHIPVTILDGSKNAIGSVSVSMTNTAGTSQTVKCEKGIGRVRWPTPSFSARQQARTQSWKPLLAALLSCAPIFKL